MAGNKKLLLFHMDEGKASLIKTVCHGLDIRVVKIYQPQYGEKIGALAGIPIYAMTNRSYTGDGFTREMMVICGLTDKELDAFLLAYRNANIPPVWLKATLTPHNMDWSAAQLYQALVNEHRQMTGQ